MFDAKSTRILDTGGGNLKATAILFLALAAPVSLVLYAYPTPAAADVAGVDPAINALLQRFKDTNAVGVFTKLSIKNNITRLNQSFGHYHQGKRPPAIVDLRERYDLMVQEIMVLVQNKDPELAQDLFAARQMLWSWLAEPDKYVLFQEI